MTGSATLTTEPSMKAMLDPMMVAIRTHLPTCWVAGVALVTAAECMTPSSEGAFTKLAIYCFHFSFGIERVLFDGDALNFQIHLYESGDNVAVAAFEVMDTFDGRGAMGNGGGYDICQSCS